MLVLQNSVFIEHKVALLWVTMWKHYIQKCSLLMYEHSSKVIAVSKLLLFRHWKLVGVASNNGLCTFCNNDIAYLLYKSRFKHWKNEFYWVYYLQITFFSRECLWDKNIVEYMFKRSSLVAKKCLKKGRRVKCNSFIY